MPEPTPYLSQCLGERPRARVVSVENRMAIILKKKLEEKGREMVVVIERRRKRQRDRAVQTRER